MAQSAPEEAMGAPDSQIEQSPRHREARIEYWSSEFLDSRASTRLHLTTRFSLSDGHRVFGGGSAWSFELFGTLGVAEGVGLSARVPLGVRQPSSDEPVRAFMGNLSLGTSLGHPVELDEDIDLLFAAGLDAYLPTLGEQSPGAQARAAASVAVIRAHEPQLYIPQFLGARIRAQAGISLPGVELQLELGLVPGVTVRQDSDAVLLSSVAARVNGRLGDTVEPFVELGASFQIAGAGDVSPPVMLTPGVRLHITDFFDPAVFASINFVESAVLVFGVDIGGALRTEEPKTRQRTPHRRDDWLEL